MGASPSRSGNIEIRISKSETISETIEIRKSDSALYFVSTAFTSFEFVSNFDIRISDFPPSRHGHRHQPPNQILPRHHPHLLAAFLQHDRHGDAGGAQFAHDAVRRLV